MTGISGDHDYNVIGLDFCDAQVGDPSPGKSPPRRSWLAHNVTIDHLVASDGDGAGHVYNCGEGLRITGVTNLVLSSSDVERLGQCYSNTRTIGVILVSVQNVTFLDDMLVGVPATSSPDQGGIDEELFVDGLHLLGNLMGGNAGPLRQLDMYHRVRHRQRLPRERLRRRRTCGRGPELRRTGRPDGHRDVEPVHHVRPALHASGGDDGLLGQRPGGGVGCPVQLAGRVLRHRRGLELPGAGRSGRSVDRPVL